MSGPLPDDELQQRKSRTESIRFLDSMPRPLIVAFIALATAGIGLVIWLIVNPPDPTQVALELRRSPPSGPYSHDVVRATLVDVPDPLPSFNPPCPEISGVIVEGGEAAAERVRAALRSLCPAARPDMPVEAQQAVRALATARIRFALFTRTGDVSTADLSARRILLAIALSRTNVPPEILAPLLAHEGYHLSHGLPVTASHEFRARVAELAVCRLLKIDVGDFARGCTDASAVVRLGEARAVDLLVRAGFPR